MRLRSMLRTGSSGSKSQAGYSLIELLITMMIMMIVMVAVYGIWNGLAKAYLFAEDDTRAQDEARTAMREIVEYIRTARLPQTVSSESLKAIIPYADMHEIWVWTDLDRDPSHDLELVRFMAQYDSSVGEAFLVQQESPGKDGNFTGSAVRVINQNVRNCAFDNSGNLIRDPAQSEPIFRYFDAKGAEISTASGAITDTLQIREIEIELRVDIDPARQPYFHSIETTVQPRNLRQY